jgi:hypothetical protein
LSTSANVTGPASGYTLCIITVHLLPHSLNLTCLAVVDSIGCTFTWQATIPVSICGDNKTTGTEQCDPPGVGCCDASCNFINASANFVCRPAASQCDVPEYCPGTSATCPTDSLAPTNSPCSLNCSSSATCQAGVCISNKPLDCTGGYCNATLNVCKCTNSSMTYPFCLSSCPAQTYGPDCQYNCSSCLQGTCGDGPTGNGTCVCNKDWYGMNCSLTVPPVFQQAKFAADGTYLP